MYLLFFLDHDPNGIDARIRLMAGDGVIKGGHLVPRSKSIICIYEGLPDERYGSYLCQDEQK